MKEFLSHIAELSFEVLLMSFVHYDASSNVTSIYTHIIHRKLTRIIPSLNNLWSASDNMALKQQEVM